MTDNSRRDQYIEQLRVLGELSQEQAKEICEWLKTRGPEDLHYETERHISIPSDSGRGYAHLKTSIKIQRS